MFKIITFLYVVSYSCYIFYTREPDYFDGEIIYAEISISNNEKLANYIVEGKLFSIPADYIFRKLNYKDKIKIIYLPAHPEKAAVYSLWGYWFRWSELLVSFVLIFGLYKLATSITDNPTHNTENDMIEEKPRKYV